MGNTWNVYVAGSGNRRPAQRDARIRRHVFHFEDACIFKVKQVDDTKDEIYV